MVAEKFGPIWIIVDKSRQLCDAFENECDADDELEDQLAEFTAFMRATAPAKEPT
jgi:hypothetical protein